ncbi:hypothetical protein DFJ63DRAFT_333938 [Scheffersomyces coipomensis]|uniref:uncharacterized protein n=1 Tax=Scheffersomyces coipomensis TaxID=1788519 RepID=UPI00315C618D
MASVDQKYTSYLFVLVAFIVPVLINIFNGSNGLTDLEKVAYYLENELIITIPIVLRFGDEGFNFPDLAKAVQIQLDEELNNTYTRLKIDLIDELEYSKTAKNETPIADQYTVELIHSEEDFIGIDSEESKCYIFYTLDAVHSNDLPYYIVQGIVHHLLLPEIWTFKQNKVPKKLIQSNSSYDILIMANSQEDGEVIEKELNGYFKADGLWDINISLENDTSSNRSNEFKVVLQSNSDKEDSSNKLAYLSIEDENSLSSVKKEIIKYLGISEHPSNNFKIKLQTLYRFFAIKLLGLSIEKLTNLENTTSPHLDKVVHSVFDLAAEFETSKSASWVPLFTKSKRILQQIESFDNQTT